MFGSCERHPKQPTGFWARDSPRDLAARRTVRQMWPAQIDRARIVPWCAGEGVSKTLQVID
jgi:hypothetical protein